MANGVSSVVDTGVNSLVLSSQLEKEINSSPIDLKKVIEIKNENIQSKCGWSPFNGYKFKGTPVATIVNGEIKMKNGQLLGQASGKPMLF